MLAYADLVCSKSLFPCWLPVHHLRMISLPITRILDDIPRAYIIKQVIPNINISQLISSIFSKLIRPFISRAIDFRKMLSELMGSCPCGGSSPSPGIVKVVPVVNGRIRYTGCKRNAPGPQSLRRKVCAVATLRARKIRVILQIGIDRILIDIVLCLLSVMREIISVCCVTVCMDACRQKRKNQSSPNFLLYGTARFILNTKSLHKMKTILKCPGHASGRPPSFPFFKIMQC